MRISLFGNLRISFAGRQITAVNTNRLQSLLVSNQRQSESSGPVRHTRHVVWSEVIVSVDPDPVTTTGWRPSKPSTIQEISSA